MSDAIATPDGTFNIYGGATHAIHPTTLHRAEKGDTRPAQLPVTEVEALPDPMDQLSTSTRKLADKWAAQFGAVPADELRFILSNFLGINSDEVPEMAARRAIVLWINGNELRMKRDLKNGSQAMAAKDSPKV